MNKLTKIIACSLPLLASCYPARICKQSVDKAIYECRVIESFTDQVAGRNWRYTEAYGSCTIDGFLGKDYVILVDRECDRSVDECIRDSDIQDRESFGDDYDGLFLQIKKLIGDRSIVEEEE